MVAGGRRSGCPGACGADRAGARHWTDRCRRALRTAELILGSVCGHGHPDHPGYSCMTLASVAYVFSSCPASCPLPFYLQPSCAAPPCVPLPSVTPTLAGVEHMMILTGHCTHCPSNCCPFLCHPPLHLHSLHLLAKPFPSAHRLESAQGMQVTAVSPQSVEQ